ncbi:DUF488 domain-containing protein [Nocardiopsis sp. HNM0947]|uniref:DUF488 domain-containing protein n=1 Tax=Nocardiopsis coralli TaxID=2772213 RepID=A0ABR9P3X4_9ACTN|nr:DUF488 domain-containing protein [Nocardiopsis coralli]MBE2998536.1 DUF488 domain-containing protein [Nocardiopsis coralli]
MSGTEIGTASGAARGRFFTVGHSNRTLAEFTGLLQEHGITLVVDVRRLPGSARYPQFDEDTLAGALADLGTTLRRAEELTGRRPVSKDVPFEVNGWWRNRSFHNYADHALSEGFGRALELLREWGHERPTAVMCAEAVWWRCHRRIIADHLIARGEDVFHVLGPGRGEPARLSAGAVVGGDGGGEGGGFRKVVTYPERRGA